ncbi:hypothetical protein [Paenibacillus marinisediminis]
MSEILVVADAAVKINDESDAVLFHTNLFAASFGYYPIGSGARDTGVGGYQLSVKKNRQ